MKDYPTKGASVLAAIAKIPDPPPAPTFTPDRTASPQARMAAMLGAQLAIMEDRLSRGEDVAGIELQRLNDAIEGRTAPPDADADGGHYDLSKLDLAETEQLHALLMKARRS